MGRTLSIVVLSIATGAALAGPDLDASQSALAPFLGGWAIESQWASGAPINAQAKYTPGLNEQFLYAAVRSVREDGTANQRYFSVFRVEEGLVHAKDFVYDGSVRDSIITPEGGGVYTTSWPMGDTTIRERMALSSDTLDWTVWSGPDEEWTVMLEDEWERVPAELIELPQRPTELAATVAPLSRFLGEWSIDTAWSDGTALSSRNEFTVGVGGQFLETQTFVLDDDGSEYERYFTVYAFDAESGGIVAHGFTFDGTSSVTPMEVSPDGSEMKAEWSLPGGATTIRQHITFTSDDSYRWQVWVKPEGANEFESVMDDVWHRTGG